jgi:hypothetical protein
MKKAQGFQEAGPGHGKTLGQEEARGSGFASTQAAFEHDTAAYKPA